MSTPKTTAKGGRPSRNLDEEILAAAEKLQQLKDRKREEERRARERNLKAIMDLIKSEGLDEAQATEWKAAVPKLRKALKLADEPQPTGEAGKAEPARTTSAAEALA